MNLFKDVIEHIVQTVEGAVSALIVGVDGIVIDRAYREETDRVNLNYELVAAEYTSLLKTALRTAEDVEIGHLQEMTVFTEEFDFVIKMITEEYFLMFIMKPAGNFGRARYELKKAKIMLEKEFTV